MISFSKLLAQYTQAQVVFIVIWPFFKNSMLNNRDNKFNSGLCVFVPKFANFITTKPQS